MTTLSNWNENVQRLCIVLYPVNVQIAFSALILNIQIDAFSLAAATNRILAAVQFSMFFIMKLHLYSAYIDSV